MISVSLSYDGAALAHLLPTASITTFDKCADSVILPHHSQQLEKCVHLDVVRDVYITDAIKTSTREKRGATALEESSWNKITPRNWMDFLHDEKKIARTQSFHLLRSTLAARRCLLPKAKEF